MVFSSDIRNGFIQYGQTLKSLKLLTGDLDGQTQLLAATVQNLTPKQQALALATRGVNQAQIAEVLSLNNVEKKQTQQILFDTALITKKKQLTKAYALEAITAQGLSSEKAQEIMRSAGIVAANNSEVISKKQVSVATLEAKLAQEGLSATQIKAITTQLGLGTSTLTLSNYFKGLAASTWASVKAIGAFLISNPVGWCIMAAGAIAGVVAAVDLFTVSLKEQQEITQKLQDEYDEITQKLSDVETELKTVTDRIDELNKKEHLSFVEQEELDRLTETNTQLERQNAILKEQQEIKGRELAKSIQTEYKKDFQDKDLSNDNASRNEKIDVNLQKYKSLQESIDSIQNEINYIVQQGFEIPSEYQRQLDELQAKQGDIRKQLIDDAVDIQEYINKYNLDDDFAEQLQKNFEKIDRTLNSVDYKTIDFDRIIKIDKFKDDVEEIKQLTKDGLLDKTVLNKQFPELVEAFNEAGISTDEIINQFYSLNQVTETTDFNAPIETATELSEVIETTSKKVKLITTAMEEMNDTGYISSSTYAEIVEMGGNFADCLEVQNGKLKLNVQKLKELERQEILNAIAAKNLAISELNVSAAMAGQARDAEKVEEIRKQITALEEERAVLWQINDEIANAKANESGGSGEEETPTEIQNFLDDYAKYHHDINMGIKKEDEDYFNWLEKAAHDAYSKYPDYQDDLWKYEEEVYKGRKQLAEDFYDEQQKLFEDRVSNLETNIEVATKYSTDADGNKLNIEEKYDYISSAYQEIINEINARIGEILDVGIEGHEDEVAKLEKQIEEYQEKLSNVFKSAVEEEQDYIEKQKKAYSDLYDERIDKIKEQQKAVEEAAQAEIDAVQEKIDVLKEANEKAEEANEIEKARQDLANASQRTRQVYGADGSISLQVDQDKVKEAQEKLDKLLQEQQINILEEQKQTLEDAKNKASESYDRIIENLETEKENGEKRFDILLDVLDRYLNPDNGESNSDVWKTLAHIEGAKYEDGTWKDKDGNVIDIDELMKSAEAKTDDKKPETDNAKTDTKDNGVITGTMERMTFGSEKSDIDNEVKGKTESAIDTFFSNLEKKLNMPSGSINLENAMQVFRNSPMMNFNPYGVMSDRTGLANKEYVNNVNNQQNITPTFTGDININNPVGNSDDLAKELMMNIPIAFQKQMYSNLK